LELGLGHTKKLFDAFFSSTRSSSLARKWQRSWGAAIFLCSTAIIFFYLSPTISILAAQQDNHIISTTKIRSTCSQQKEVLMNNTNGGMILFWHVPKTGGSTLRRRYAGGWHRKKGLHTNVIGSIDMGLRKKHYVPKKKRLEAKYLTASSSNNNNDTLFWEIHGGPSLSTINVDIRHWRSLAKLNNKTFFAFTIVRDGPAAAISYFNFYCQQPICNNTVFGPHTFTNSEAGLLQNVATWRNYQSRILFHGDYNGTEWYGPNRQISETESHLLYEESELDWIGIIETLSSMTIPLLDYLATGNSNFVSPRPIQNEKVAATTTTTTTKMNISMEDTKYFLEENTKLDHILWQRARNDFSWNKTSPSIIQTRCLAAI
jgi:hypothetical protein